MSCPCKKPWARCNNVKSQRYASQQTRSRATLTGTTFLGVTKQSTFWVSVTSPVPVLPVGCSTVFNSIPLPLSGFDPSAWLLSTMLNPSVAGPQFFLYRSTPNFLMADRKPKMLESIQHSFKSLLRGSLLSLGMIVTLSTVAMKGVRPMFLVYQVREGLVLSTMHSSMTATLASLKKCFPQEGRELVFRTSRRVYNKSPSCFTSSVSTEKT